MPTFKINIGLSQSEWEKIYVVIRKRLKGKTVHKYDKKTTWFITNAINQEFSKNNEEECSEIKSEIVYRHHEIKVSQDIFDQITCQANAAGIPISTLIKRKIFDVHL